MFSVGPFYSDAATNLVLEVERRNNRMHDAYDIFTHTHTHTHSGHFAGDRRVSRQVFPVLVQKYHQL